MNTTTLTLETLHLLSDGLAQDFRQQLEAADPDDVLIGFDEFRGRR